MKTREYNKYIRGFMYALNQCAEGNILNLKNRYFQSQHWDNFDNGLIKGVLEYEKKHP